MSGKATAKDLARASIDGKIDVVKALLAAGVSPNDAVEFGGTSLVHAAAAGQTAIVALLLDAGAAIEATTTASGAGTGDTLYVTALGRVRG